MGKIIVSEFISLDGVTQAPGGKKEDTDGGFRHGGWSIKFFDPETLGAAWDDLAKRSEALLEGRRTWQVSGPAWSKQSGNPFADWINAVQKYVVSDTLTEADLTWKPTTIIRNADLVAEASRLRDELTGDITILGSASVARTLLAADLVDELVLMIEPIVLGGGKTIFPADGQARTFALTTTTRSKTGVQVSHYHRTP